MIRDESTFDLLDLLVALRRLRDNPMSDEERYSLDREAVLVRNEILRRCGEDPLDEPPETLSDYIECKASVTP